MRAAKDVAKSSARKSGVQAIQAGKEKKTKSVKTVEVALKQESKPLALTKELIMSPPESVLKPFREAAKKTKERQKAQAAQAQVDKGKSFLAKQPAKGKKLVLDLRVHAPGTVGYFANGGMPAGTSLARLAAAKGVDVIGVAEYYNAQYIDLIQQTMGKETLTILPAFVACCRVGACQEVFLLCLFKEGTPASAIFDTLKALEVPSSAFGDRSYCLAQDLGTILEIVESRGGVVIPSRCDKTPYRQLALATLVEDYGFHVFDLAHPDSPELFRSRWPQGEFTFLSFSSATALGQIGNRVGKLRMATSGFEGIRQLAARRN